ESHHRPARAPELARGARRRRARRRLRVRPGRRRRPRDLWHRHRDRRRRVRRGARRQRAPRAGTRVARPRARGAGRERPVGRRPRGRHRPPPGSGPVRLLRARAVGHVPQRSLHRARHPRPARLRRRALAHRAGLCGADRLGPRADRRPDGADEHRGQGVGARRRHRAPGLRRCDDGARDGSRPDRPARRHARHPTRPRGARSRPPRGRPQAAAGRGARGDVPLRGHRQDARSRRRHRGHRSPAARARRHGPRPARRDRLPDRRLTGGRRAAGRRGGAGTQPRARQPGDLRDGQRQPLALRAGRFRARGGRSRLARLDHHPTRRTRGRRQRTRARARRHQGRRRARRL
ncbi:MAG: Glucose 1-dehydrogenase, partial [uncultured Solirubrobacteraceae bacterium]